MRVPLDVEEFQRYLPLPASLAQAITSWDDELTAIYRGDDPQLWRFESPAVRQDWQGRGRTLAEHLARELPDDMTIGYFGTEIIRRGTRSF
ncbi:MULTISPECIES: hypothetical protein [Actinoalloteichus]|nr:MULTISPECIES: hypothetical protein [Actinoalloteichus]